jgi:hypothetical protein
MVRQRSELDLFASNPKSALGLGESGEGRCPHSPILRHELFLCNAGINIERLFSFTASGWCGLKSVLCDRRAKSPRTTKGVPRGSRCLSNRLRHIRSDSARLPQAELLLSSPAATRWLSAAGLRLPSISAIDSAIASRYKRQLESLGNENGFSFTPMRRLLHPDSDHGGDPCAHGDGDLVSACRTHSFHKRGLSFEELVGAAMFPALHV